LASSRVTLWLLAKPTTKGVGLKLWGQGIFKPYDDFAQQTLLGEAGEEISAHALMQSLGGGGSRRDYINSVINNACATPCGFAL
jgi:hypothetical protein